MVMKVANRVGGSGRLTYRDKRLSYPSLYIDLRDKIYRTAIWDPGRLIVSDFDGRIATGEEFSGVMKISGNPKTYLFEGRSIKSDFVHKKMAATFEILNPAGRELLQQHYENRDPEGKKPLPTLLFSMAYRTVNWSLSGFLIGNYRGNLKLGSNFSGLVRLEKTDRAAVFRAEAKRMVGDCNGMAAQFGKFGPELFDLFELAMKKSTEAPPQP